MNRRLLLLLFIYCALFMPAQAQEDLATDYLPAGFYAGRRQAFLDKMPAHSVAVVFAYPTRVFSRDIDYVYHPNPDLYYLTGYKEPNAILFLYKDAQTVEGQSTHTVFFVQSKDSSMEMVTGKRLGVTGVQTKLGISPALYGAALKNFPLHLDQQQKLLLPPLPSGPVNDPEDSTDLFDLLATFKEKAGLAPDYDGEVDRLLSFLPQYNVFFNRVGPFLKNMVMASPKYAANPLFTAFVNGRDSLQRDSIARIAVKSRNDYAAYGRIMNDLRGIKTPEEMDLIRKSVAISCYGQREVMKAMQPGMSEREIQGIHEFVHKKYGAETVGYGSIVGAGNNGCILHYEENDRVHVGNQLVLMDVGAEYHGYSADVTRTVPANGKFSVNQKLIYDLVYQAQEEVFKICKEGTPFAALNEKAKGILAAGLIKLGIISSAKDIDTYYPHGCSHHMGLDVHDRGAYDTLRAGMVFTVEPGLYIPEGSACDKKWWGIGVRIEDDVMITATSYELLSGLAPRRTEDIEKLMAEKSLLNDFSLPALK